MNKEKFLHKSRDDLMDFFLVTSDEKYLILQFLNKAEEKLRTGKDDEFSRIKFDESEENFWREFKRAVTTINMLTAYKFVVVECQNLFSQKTPYDDELIKIMDRQPRKVSVFFWKQGDVDGRIKTTKKMDNKGNLIELKAPKFNDLDEWIKKKFAQYEKKAGNELVETLEFLYDNKLEALHQEIEKIITLNYEKKTINIEDCREILSREGILGDKVIFQMIDSWAENNSEKAVRIYRRLVREGSTGNYVHMYIISMIQRQLRLLLSVKELKQKFSGHKKIADELGEHPYPIKKCLKQEKRFSREELVEFLRSLLQANRRIVKGKYVDQQDPIEDFLLEI